ncbi:hypothetical protein B0T25DRAFT_342329 [Lasiosphaeria hispida]|uniref:Uncharacterized protein n=1 Tax=Lasiosphaeria hispida TaxID=260671 RepID=A0AAJ0H6A7_9PEZI|nr:hypothetical protein B0T25DRAFT_342329 [Lasiosphaeria hispida]
MAITMDAPINPPDIRSIAVPVLSALPGAAISTQPATTILPLLSPILRQRVQLLSTASTDPWIKFLTYDTSKVPRLTEIAQNGTLEPHPVSGEIEVDWDYDAQIQYRRLDQETLQTLVVLKEFDLFLRLVYCTGDKDGGGDGWRVGEVGVASNPSPLDSFGGFGDLSEAEKAFRTQSATGNRQQARTNTSAVISANNVPTVEAAADEEEEEDDGYWDRYDATPARTPAVKRSPAPQSTAQTLRPDPYRSSSAEDAYYAQYDTVQPAMDNHDPDEEVPEEFLAPPPLGLARPSHPPESAERTELNETSGAWTLADPPRSPSVRSSRSRDDDERAATLLHPRPASSASTNGSLTVAKLEESAEKQEQNEFGVKQHVSRSIRSLFLLSRSSGIEREEFERMVKTELDVLGMVADDI